MGHLTAEEIKSALQGRRGLFPEQLTEANLRAAGCTSRVCVLPENFNERLSYLGDVLVQATCSSPKDDRLRSTVGKLCQALSYMLNSASWRDGELHDFDVMELQRKLDRFTKREATNDQ